jgi:hypothetical protein
MLRMNCIRSANRPVLDGCRGDVANEELDRFVAGFSGSAALSRLTRPHLNVPILVVNADFSRRAGTARPPGPMSGPCPPFERPLPNIQRSSGHFPPLLLLRFG